MTQLQEEWMRQKTAERAEVERQVEVIRAKEAAIAKKEEVTDADVAEAQRRIDEAAQHLAQFTFF